MERRIVSWLSTVDCLDCQLRFIFTAIAIVTIVRIVVKSQGSRVLMNHEIGYMDWLWNHVIIMLCYVFLLLSVVIALQSLQSLQYIIALHYCDCVSLL